MLTESFDIFPRFQRLAHLDILSSETLTKSLSKRDVIPDEFFTWFKLKVMVAGGSDLAVKGGTLQFRWWNDLYDVWFNER